MKIAVINKDICVACGACVKACKREAVAVWRGCYAIVREDNCVGCGLCGKTCPAGCITITERSAAK